MNIQKRLSLAVAALLGLLGLLGSNAQALQIASVSPQGQFASVRQVVAKFDESAVNFDDPKAPAPLALTCSDAQATKGSGRWISDREWAYEFERDLPPGVSCTLQVRAGFKTPKGDVLAPSAKSPGGYKFNTGGPFVRNIRPYPGGRIDEEQFFVLQLNGAATLATVQANLWGGLALEKFSAKFEAMAVAGVTKASSSTGSAAVDWSKVERIKTTDASGAAHQTTFFGAPASPGNVRNNSMFLPWKNATAKDAGKDTLTVSHQGPGKPWLTLQSVAAIVLKEPFNAGYQIKKTITPVEQANTALPAGSYTRGDVLRITLEVNASADMTWAVITDPIPAGATILGSAGMGLGRDSQIATQGEKKSGAGWPAFEERSFESFRSYYEYLPKGVVKMEYTIRLNNAGEFSLPPSRVEAMYAPEIFGEAPNARVSVK